MEKGTHVGPCDRCGKSGPGNYWSPILAPGDDPAAVLAAPVLCWECHAAERCPECGQTVQSGHLPACPLIGDWP